MQTLRRAKQVFSDQVGLAMPLCKFLMRVALDQYTFRTRRVERSETIVKHFNDFMTLVRQIAILIRRRSYIL